MGADFSLDLYAKFGVEFSCYGKPVDRYRGRRSPLPVADRPDLLKAGRRAGGMTDREVGRKERDKTVHLAFTMLFFLVVIAGILRQEMS